MPELIHDTIQLINQEWPRSIGARMWSLESSKDNLPTCLVLTKSKSATSDNKSENDDSPSVLGHLKLTPIPSKPFACFIESVVVWKSLRGQGVGSYFMNEAEKYCKFNLKLEVVYLSTTDKIEFYKKLGYEICEPISIFGGPSKGIFKPVNKKTYMNKVLIESSDDEQSWAVPVICFMLLLINCYTFLHYHQNQNQSLHAFSIIPVPICASSLTGLVVPRKM